MDKKNIDLSSKVLKIGNILILISIFINILVDIVYSKNLDEKNIAILILLLVFFADNKKRRN